MPILDWDNKYVWNQPTEQEQSLRLDLTKNVLAHLDNKILLTTMYTNYPGCVDLIYIDPPFNTEKTFYTKRGAKAYEDNWGGLDDYLNMLFHRISMMKYILKPHGIIFVHCDYRTNGYIRVLLDEIFGYNCFKNEITWRRAPNLGNQAASNQLGRTADNIFVYVNDPATRFKGKFPTKSTKLENKNGRPIGVQYDEQTKQYFTTAPRGDYTDKSIEELRKQNRIYETDSGKIYIKYFLRYGDDGYWYKDIRADTIWDDYDVRPLRHRPKTEDQNYVTQKPEGLLERIILWATNPGDLVADFFCGSGTTLAVAQRLGRSWIGCDTSDEAIRICRARLGPDIEFIN